ncbi:MAG: peroxiredoxin family protein [Actinomycetota bacterium]|nr:peroxiredoxin family protein [Actinomycetota bacterium]
MTTGNAPPDVGDAAPPLELPSLDGRDFRLADLRGRPVIVSFLRHAG